MRRSRFLAAGAAFAAAASSRPALAQFDPNLPYAQLLNIAVNVPLSGPFAPYGRQIADGARAAVDENNRFSGPLERVFGIRTFDDQNALAVAITNAQFAAGDTTVVATIGGLTSEVTIGAIPEYANDGMALIVPATTADAVTGRSYRNVFRLPTKDSVEGALFARTVLAAAKPAFALAITQDAGYGPDLARGFVAQAKADRRNADVFSFSYASPDYAAAAKAILAKKPDYLFLAGKISTMGPLVTALAAAGYRGAYGLGDGFYDPATPAQYGTALSGAWVATSFPPLRRAPSDFQALADLERRVGDVTAFSAFGYAAAQVVISAVKRANARDKFATLSALASGGTYETLTGSYSFDFSGDPIDPNVYFFSVGKDGFKYEKPAHPTGFIL